MKLKLIFAALILASANASAVNTSLETGAEKYSYAIGINFAQSLMRQGAPIDADAVYMALRDALEGATPRMSADDMTAALRSEAQKAGERKRSKAGENLASGKAFREKNKSKEGVTTLSNGIQYEVLRKGAGDQPKATDSVKVHYTGTLIDGREFDSSKRGGEPVTFGLDQVIKGWQDVIPLMRTGSRWLVTIPPDRAYGVNGAGAVIGPNETLIFEIDLLEVM
jgi:FKBP-type peptidyl-prolyl cis-trans isomerase FklB